MRNRIEKLILLFYFVAPALTLGAVLPQQIVIGASPNNEDGDPARTAYLKITANENFLAVNGGFASNLTDLSINYPSTFFVSQSRGNDLTAVSNSYAMPFATVTGAAAIAPPGSLIYVLDGGFYGGASAPSIVTGADVFLANGVTMTNFTWGATNALQVGGKFHIFGHGYLASDTASQFNSIFLLDNGTTGGRTNTGITYVVQCKGISAPTNTPVILGGRSWPYTNQIFISCDDDYSGPIETDSANPTGGNPAFQGLLVSITANNILTGSGNGSVGSHGNSVDQTNRLYSLFGRRSVTLSPVGNGIAYAFCTFNILSGYFTDLRSGVTAPANQIVNLSPAVHVTDSSQVKANNFYSLASSYVNDDAGLPYLTAMQLGATNSSAAVSNAYFLNGNFSVLNAPTNAGAMVGINNFTPVGGTIYQNTSGSRIMVVGYATFIGTSAGNQPVLTINYTNSVGASLLLGSTAQVTQGNYLNILPFMFPVQNGGGFQFVISGTGSVTLGPIFEWSF